MSFTRNIARDRSVIAELLDRLGLPITLISMLIAHAAAVEQASGRLGLVSPSNRYSIVPRHTADSLLFALARRPIAGEVWRDVGSGAGFPGLVLACCYPSTRFVLSEPLQKRAGFLNLVTASLGVSNVSVHADISSSAGDGFDVSVARAFRAPASAFKEMLPRVRVGGVAVVASGPDELLPEGAREVAIGGIGFVDSPGRLFMMTREG